MPSFFARGTMLAVIQLGRKCHMTMMLVFLNSFLALSSLLKLSARNRDAKAVEVSVDLSTGNSFLVVFAHPDLLLTYVFWC